MKKILSVFAFAAAVLAAVPSCTKDNNDGDDNSIITPGGDEGGENGGTTGDKPASLSGSDYAVIILDETSLGAVQSKVATNLGPDDTNSFLYIWEGTYNPGVCSGVNFYGQAADWTALTVGSVGWSGCGFFIATEPAGLADWRARVAAAPESYYLHFALKPGKEGDIHCISFIWGSTKWVAGIGGAFNDNGTVYNEVKPVGGTLVANEWNEFEISVADMGINFNQALKDGGDNYMTFLSGGATGTQLNLDAVFVYKK